MVQRLKDEQWMHAEQIFKSANLSYTDNDAKRLAEFLKNSDNWVKAQIRLTEIALNMCDSKLLLEIVDTISRSKFDKKIKEELLVATSRLSKDKIANEIKSALYYVQTKEMEKIVENYGEDAVGEIIFRIGRIAARKRKEEMGEIINILNEKETVETVNSLAAKHGYDEKSKEKLILSIGETVHLISNSDSDEFRKFRGNLTEVVDKIKQEYNITHFGRHSASMLNKLYEYSTQIEAKKNEKIFVFAYSYADHNGAFYSDARHNDALSKYGKVLIVEAENDVEFVEILNKMKEKHGAFNGLFIAGHGTPTSIKLGENEKYSSYLDVTDYDLMSRIGNHMDKSDKNAFIALISCSTGNEQTTRSLANWIAAVTKVPYVYAPEKEFTQYSMNVDMDRDASVFRKNKRITISYYLKKGTVPTMEFGIRKQKN